MQVSLVTRASSPASPSSFLPLPVAIEIIGVMTIAMIGSSITSQLVDLDIADVGGRLCSFML
jgi:hypothetical protein